jgi:hypothetical protein
MHHKWPLVSNGYTRALLELSHAAYSSDKDARSNLTYLATSVITSKHVHRGLSCPIKALAGWQQHTAAAKNTSKLPLAAFGIQRVDLARDRLKSWISLAVV